MKTRTGRGLPDGWEIEEFYMVSRPPWTLFAHGVSVASGEDIDFSDDPYQGTAIYASDPRAIEAIKSAIEGLRSYRRDQRMRRNIEAERDAAADEAKRASEANAAVLSGGRLP